MLIIPPQVRQKTVIEQVAPRGPVMTAISANIILVQNIVVQKSFMQGYAAGPHPTFSLNRTLANKKVIDFFINVRIIEELSNRVLAIDVTSTEHSKRGEHIQ